MDPDTMAILVTKVIKKSSLVNCQIRSWRREIHIHKQLEHPHIVHLIDGYETKDYFALIMEQTQHADYFEERLNVFNKPYWIKSDGGVVLLKLIIK